MCKLTSSRIAVQQMGHRPFGDHQPAGLQALMHLWNRAMLPETPEANQGNDIQAEFAVWQRPTSFFFGMRAHMIARTRGGVALTDSYSELEDPR
jgi:hypothetical protein